MDLSLCPGSVGSMAKTSVQYLCSECGWSGPKWVGRCPECGQWGTVEEFHEARPAARSRTAEPGRTSRTKASDAIASSAATAITDVATDSVERVATGFQEFDRVLGGGIESLASANPRCCSKPPAISPVPTGTPTAPYCISPARNPRRKSAYAPHASTPWSRIFCSRPPPISPRRLD